MIRTRKSIKESYGPVELASENMGFEVLEDADGDYWIGRFAENEEYTLVTKGSVSEFAEALDGAGLLPEEYTPDDDPSPSPEDVADEWVRLTDSAGSTVYMPNDAGLEVENRPGNCASTLRFEHSNHYARNGELKKGPRYWYTTEYDRVPAEEVPADD